MILELQQRVATKLSRLFWNHEKDATSINPLCNEPTSSKITVAYLTSGQNNQHVCTGHNRLLFVFVI